MAGITPSSSVNLGKKPDWRLTSEQLLRLPSVVNGIDINQELKMRQQAAQFIQDMADKLNQNVQQRGKMFVIIFNNGVASKQEEFSGRGSGEGRYRRRVKKEKKPVSAAR